MLIIAPFLTGKVWWKEGRFAWFISGALNRKRTTYKNVLAVANDPVTLSATNLALHLAERAVD